MQVDQGLIRGSVSEAWLLKASSLLARENIADLLQGAFRCGWPGFAADYTQAIAQSFSSRVNFLLNPCEDQYVLA